MFTLKLGELSQPAIGVRWVDGSPDAHPSNRQNFFSGYRYHSAYTSSSPRRGIVSRGTGRPERLEEASFLFAFARTMEL